MRRGARRSGGPRRVLQFPVDEAARKRLAFGQARLHVEALERELQALAKERHRTSGEWARLAAVPLVRTECIDRYLAVAIGSAVRAGESGRVAHEHKVQEQFRDALYATATSLSRLGDPAAGQPERRQLLGELSLLARGQAQIFTALGKLFEGD